MGEEGGPAAAGGGGGGFDRRREAAEEIGRDKERAVRVGAFWEEAGGTRAPKKEATASHETATEKIEGADSCQRGSSRGLFGKLAEGDGKIEFE